MLTQLAFYSHYLGDYFFTHYQIYYFSPFSSRQYLCENALWLGHPVNHAINLAALASVVVLGIYFKRTPIELVSVKLDDRIVNLFFRRKPLTCHLCSGKTNEACEACNRPVCHRHAPVTRKLDVVCEECGADKSR